MFENLVLRHLFLCAQWRETTVAVWELSVARASCIRQRLLRDAPMVARYSKADIKESRPRDARTQEGYVEKRKQREKGNEPLAGYRNRPLRGATRWEESSKEGREEESQT